MDDNKKCAISRSLSYLFFFITVIIIISKNKFNNDTLVFILAIVFTFLFIIFELLRIKYDEKKNKRQFKNAAIFFIVSYILIIISYSLAFSSVPENSIYMIIAISVVSTTYHIIDYKLRDKSK